MSDVASVMDKGWQATLSLGFGFNQHKTILTHRKHQGPLVIQKPFYPEGEPCHVYLLHPPGGVVGGDELRLQIQVEDRAHALVTTPASGKFYRSGGKTASLQQNLSVQAGGILEWLPQETILFAGSQVKMQTNIMLANGAGFFGWEMLCLGRPASGEKYSLGKCEQRFSIWCDDEPVVIENTRLYGAAPVLSQTWGLQGANVVGTAIGVGANKDMLKRLRDEKIQVEQGLFSVTLIKDVLICRVLAQQAEPARQAFIKAWKVIRPELYKRVACPPRIWFT